MIRSVLIIGSGPIAIGQAAEFDYSGTQACLACREWSPANPVRTILVNSNPATIQTDVQIADVVYIEPLTVESLEAIIAAERPDGVIATAGGQTALNLSVALDECGALARHGVRVLGTGLEAIRRGEDRALFAATLRDAGQPILPSRAVTSVEAALEAAEEIGYPVMCRSAFALGGAGSGLASNRTELARQARAGLSFSGSGQVLIEKSVYGWSEIEYEVIRDGAGNCMTVCNMENVDPMGVHTGDSIVVAPSQTLSDEEYHLLRASALRVVDALGVEGACNVQFALDRQHGCYYVIEVNPRLSRSSALASKATGYPIAKVATRIALGQTIPEIRNDITGTSAFFEPALDYVVVKIPRWPFDKFEGLEPVIGTSMRSTGEVMAIGRSFEEALVKAVRGIDAGAVRDCRAGQLAERLTTPNSERLPAVLTALRAGWPAERIVELTRIHPWFVDRLADLVAREGSTSSGDYVFKMVDTCAGEFEARTPYFYGTRGPGAGGSTANEAAPLPGPKAIILGSGPIRIGQGIEFDYATVHACQTLSGCGVRSIIVNNNPETVSTDYSTSDRLYFEPLDVEAVMAVVQNEAGGLIGVLPQFGGQTAINLVHALHERGVPILGTAPDAIDAAEDRGRTSSILGAHGIAIPPWRSIGRWDELPAALSAVGYPALLRPSYVLSGRGMILVHGEEDLQRYLARHGNRPLQKPLLVDHFLEDAIELNVDAVSDGETVIAVVMEQFEECGIHSGDSGEVYPAQHVGGEMLGRVEELMRVIARAFGIVGLMNVQFAVQGSSIYVLEVNPRASRSVPFASKASGLPLADMAVRAILGTPIAAMRPPAPLTDRVSVKEVVLPFRTLSGLTPVLGPEMQSTGEAMGIGPTFAAAYWKAQLGAGHAAGGRHLPFGRPVYISAHGFDEEIASLLNLLADVGCAVSVSFEVGGASGRWEMVRPDDVDLGPLGLAVVLGRSDAELALLRRAVDARVPYVTSRGGLRALSLALEEGEIPLQPVKLTEPARVHAAA
ncbi:MAG TPA: carbamoyl-phosphate synthase large subunit [Chloroflexota bacterium]|nr:carbamoyl-phosphate synthase large subunit [Chloroflexota bacterium]